MPSRQGLPAGATAPDPTPCTVRIKRSDGLEVEITGLAYFVTPTLEHLLTVLGVIQAPPPA